MKKRLVFAATLIVLAFSFTSCSKKTEKICKTTIPLESGWEYKTSPEASYQPCDDKYLNDFTPLLEKGKGIIYLRKTFTIPEELKTKDLSLYMGRVTMADRTYFNGSLVGNEGRFGPEDEWSCWNVCRYYPVSEGIINFDGINEITVEIWSDGECSIVNNPFVGEDAYVQRVYEKNSFWNAKVHFLCSFLMIILAIYHFILYNKRKADNENKMFAIINLATAFYLSVFYIEQIPGMPMAGMSFLWFQKIVSASMPFVLVYMLTSFVNTFLNRKDAKWIIIVRCVFSILPILVIFVCPNYPILRKVRIFTQIFLIPPFLYVLYDVIHELIKKTKDVKYLIIGFLPCLIVLFADMFIHNVLHFYGFPYISSLGWMSVIISFLFILANRFSDARSEAESLNADLESKVNERSKELNEANEQLEDANRKTERDMTLAVYVQESFFPRSAPQVIGWDVAYKFKPMAGVSGDLFDFYTKRNVMYGCSLFDVSGHGISSGLVTMLAKTIIGREFETGSEKKLSEVMYELNQKICDDKGDVENYLTGILLRFKGDTVEYVNGGHPPLLYRSNKGKVRQAVVPGNAPSGSLVGMKDLPVEYHTMQFKVQSGDCMLIYSDCLQESRNSQGDEFGNERVQLALANAKGETAQEKLDSLLREFFMFTGEKPLNDDLTIILLQRK